MRFPKPGGCGHPVGAGALPKERVTGTDPSSRCPVSCRWLHPDGSWLTRDVRKAARKVSPLQFRAELEKAKDRAEAKQGRAQP